VKACRKLTFGGQAGGLSGGSQRYASRASKGHNPVGPAGGRRPGLGKSVLLTRHGRSGLWLFRGCLGNRAEPRWRQRASVVAVPGSFSADNAEASCLPLAGLAGNRTRETRLQRVAHRQVRCSPRVGDAGNGYPASSWTALWLCQCLCAGRAARKVAAGVAAKAGSLGVGDLADTRDNKSAAEVGQKHLFQVRPRPRVSGKAGIAVGAKPTWP
jgi:hypothetical protein